VSTPSSHSMRLRLDSLSGFGRYLFLTIASIFTVFPIYWLITTAFKTRVEFFQNIFGLPHQFNFDNILQVLGDHSLLRFYANSLLITLSTIALVLIVGTMAGYVLARFDFKGKNVFFSIFLLTQLVPLTVIVIPLYSSLATLNLLGDRAYFGLIGSMVALNLGIAVLFTRGFFRTVSKELLEAARLDGCKELQVFWYIALPLIRAGLVVLSIIIFISTWNEYFLSLIIIPDATKFTLPLGLIYYEGQYQTFYPQLATAIFLATIPTFILYSFFQGQVIKGIGVGAGAVNG
jgi:ABC-type glycerol-3-phosphate transport system permease component